MFLQFFHGYWSNLCSLHDIPEKRSLALQFLENMVRKEIINIAVTALLTALLTIWYWRKWYRTKSLLLITAYIKNWWPVLIFTKWNVCIQTRDMHITQHTKIRTFRPSFGENIFDIHDFLNCFTGRKTFSPKLISQICGLFARIQPEWHPIGFF